MSKILALIYYKFLKNSKFDYQIVKWRICNEINTIYHEIDERFGYRTYLSPHTPEKVLSTGV